MKERWVGTGEKEEVQSQQQVLPLGCLLVLAPARERTNTRRMRLRKDRTKGHWGHAKTS